MPLVDEAIKKAKYLRGNLPLREAKLLMQTSQGQWTTKRTEYFRGKKLVEFLTTKAKAPYKVASEEDAKKVGQALLRKTYKGAPLLHRSEVHDKKKRILKATMGSKEFTLDGYYCWIYEGSQMKRNILLGMVLFGFVSCVMFPIWPKPMKVVVWYISVTLLILLAVIIIVRLIVWSVLWGIGYDCWIFPNLFADDLGVVDSFLPIYTFSRAEDYQETKMYRYAMLVMLAGICIWVYNQPTEFDDFVEGNKEFLDELYNGNLLSDVSQQSKDNIDKVVPNLEDLENMDVDDPNGTISYQHDVDENEVEESEVDEMMAKLLEEEDDAADEMDDPYAVDED